CHAWYAGGDCRGPLVEGPSGGAAARGCEERGPQLRGAFHARDRSPRTQRAAQRDGICRWSAEGGGDDCLLACAGGQVRREDEGGGALVKVRLLDSAHARSGDKGDTANVGLIALEPRWYDVLEKYLTEERVAEHFRGVITGQVERFVLPNLNAVNFLLHGA